jgi:hypothetical protein
MSSFWGIAFESFKAANGWPTALFALAFTVIAPIILPNSQIQLIYLYPIIAFLFLTSVTAIGLIATLYKKLISTSNDMEIIKSELENRNLPSIIKSTFIDTASDQYLCMLVRPNSFFGADTYTAIYFRSHDGFEILVGIGIVTTIQDSGLIQIQILNWLTSKNDLLRRVIDNDKDVLLRILVKPSPPRYFINLIDSERMPRIEGDTLGQLRAIS